MRIIKGNLFTLGFKNRSSLTVDQQQIVGFQAAAHGSFTDSNSRHAGSIFITVDNLPSGIFQLTVDPLPSTFFGLQFSHDNSPQTY